MMRINLLPPEIIAGRKVRREGALLAMVYGVVVLVLALLWLSLHLRLNNQQERLAAAQAESQSLQTKINALQRFAILEQSIKSRVTTLSGAMANDIGWSRLLRDVSNIIPSNSWLTTFSGTSEGAGAATAAAAAPAAAAPASPGAGPPGAAPPGAPAPGAPAPVTAKIGTLTFSAVTFDFPGVARWITTLEELESLQNIFVPTAAKEELAGREVVNFTSTADLSQAARSGRYQMKAP